MCSRTVYVSCVIELVVSVYHHSSACMCVLHVPCDQTRFWAESLLVARHLENVTVVTTKSVWRQAPENQIRFIETDLQQRGEEKP